MRFSCLLIINNSAEAGIFLRHYHLLPDWNPGFASASPMYTPLRHLAKKFASFEQWPGLEGFQRLLDEWPEPIQTLAGKPIKIVAQDGKPGSFEEHYAPRIYKTGELQTRTENWHDFFQYLTWFMFPKTKALINSIHLPYAQQRIETTQELGRRSAIENMLSLFDEGGAVIVSSDATLLQLIRAFKWKELFWQRRNELQEKLVCITFGHAMYEKGLAPYIGMTANCILIETDQSFFQQANTQQLQWLDNKLVELFRAGDVLTKPKDLQPFPILGMPGWDDNNNNEAYYDNRNYFRPGRNNKQQPACSEV